MWLITAECVVCWDKTLPLETPKFNNFAASPLLPSYNLILPIRKNGNTLTEKSQRVAYKRTDIREVKRQGGFIWATLCDYNRFARNFSQREKMSMPTKYKISAIAFCDSQLKKRFKQNSFHSDESYWTHCSYLLSQKQKPNTKKECNFVKS